MFSWLGKNIYIYTWSKIKGCTAREILNNLETLSKFLSPFPPLTRLSAGEIFLPHPRKLYMKCFFFFFFSPTLVHIKIPWSARRRRTLIPRNSNPGDFWLYILSPVLFQFRNPVIIHADIFFPWIYIFKLDVYFTELTRYFNLITPWV